MDVPIDNFVNIIHKLILSAQSAKMTIFDNIGAGLKGAVSIPLDVVSDPIGFVKNPLKPFKKAQKQFEIDTGQREPDPEEPDEEDEEAAAEEDAQRQQQIAAGISEPGYADPGMAPEDGEAFDAEAWREAQIQRANDFVAINTRAMDTRDRILLRPIQNRDTLRYGGTSSVPDALPLQLVHSANVV